MTVTPCSFSLSASWGSTRTCRTAPPVGNGSFSVPWIVSVPIRMLSASSCSTGCLRNGLHLGVAQPQELDQHHAKEGREEYQVANWVLALLGRLLRFWLRCLVAVVAKAEKMREAPTGRRFMSLVGLSSIWSPVRGRS